MYDGKLLANIFPRKLGKIMNNLQEFNFKGNNVRTVQIDNQPYFVGKDVADVLGYKDLLHP